MMKLNKCYIQNFGKLSEFKVDFSNGLTKIKQDNGFGKTTLAVFIKSMFYGLPQTAKRSISENERKHYLPWQGGKFGGYLEFEVNGKNYRIERFFEAKEVNDSFRLIDLATGKESKDYTKNIGEEIFGVDGASFERSVFLGQNSPDVSLTDSLSSKLFNLVEDTNDVNNCETAIERIKKIRKTFATYTGNGGMIGEIDSKIAQMQYELNNCDGCQAGIDLNRRMVENTQTEIEELNEKERQINSSIANAVEQNKLLSVVVEYNKLNKEIKELEDSINSFKSAYKNGLPEEAEINECAQWITDYATEKRVLLSYDEDNSERIEQLKSYFGSSLPSAEEIENNKRLLIENQLQQKQLIEAENTQNEILPIKNSKALWPMLIVGLICIILGVVGFIHLEKIYSLSVSIIGLAVFLISFVLNNSFRNKTKKSNDSVVNSKLQRIETIKNLISENESSVKAFVEKYSDEADLGAALDSISANLSEYEMLTKKQNETERKIAEIKSNLSAIKEKIGAFFEKYDLPRDSQPQNVIDALKKGILEAAKDEKYCQLQRAKRDKLYNDNNIANIDVNNKPDIPSLQSQIVVIRKEKDALDKKMHQFNLEIKRLTERLENGREISEEIERLNQVKVQYKEKCNLLDKTVELLAKSKENLSLRYLHKMTESFEEYCKLLGSDFDEFKISTDLEVEIEKYGQLKKSDYFSEGYKNLISLCMRLSLCDALYDGQEKPFMVLDDPFINLDDDKIKAALSVLEKLSKDRQIIYLTCHSSRV